MVLTCFSSIFFFSSRRRHTRSLCDWSSDVCSSDLLTAQQAEIAWLGFLAPMLPLTVHIFAVWEVSERDDLRLLRRQILPRRFGKHHLAPRKRLGRLHRADRRRVV